jgi:hypothetical protein
VTEIYFNCLSLNKQQVIGKNQKVQQRQACFLENKTTRPPTNFMINLSAITNESIFSRLIKLCLMKMNEMGGIKSHSQGFH